MALRVSDMGFNYFASDIFYWIFVFVFMLLLLFSCVFPFVYFLDFAQNYWTCSMWSRCTGMGDKQPRCVRDFWKKKKTTIKSVCFINGKTQDILSGGLSCQIQLIINLLAQTNWTFRFSCEGLLFFFERLPLWILIVGVSISAACAHLFQMNTINSFHDWFNCDQSMLFFFVCVFCIVLFTAIGVDQNDETLKMRRRKSWLSV